MQQTNNTGTGRALSAAAIAALWLAGVAGGLAADGPPTKPVGAPGEDGRPRVYAGENLTGIELPLGGIGAGCVCMDGAAQRTKWMFWEPWTKAPVTDSFSRFGCAWATTSPSFAPCRRCRSAT